MHDVELRFVRTRILGKDYERMRIGVYDQHWDTAGGGEKLAASYARALRSFGTVELIGHRLVDTAVLESRLDVDLAGVGVHLVPDSQEAVEEASAAFDVFVNCSFLSKVSSRARHSVYVVHFPERSGESGCMARKKLMEYPALLRTDGETEYGSGFYPRESEGDRSYRWTSGRAQMKVRNFLDVETPLRITLSNMYCPPEMPSEVVVTIDGVEKKRKIEGDTTLLFPLAPRADIDVEISSASFDVQHDPRTFGMQLIGADVGLSSSTMLREEASRQNHLDHIYGFVGSYDTILSNSMFTAKTVDSYWRRSSEVVYPGVRARPSMQKERLIVSLGRFFSGGHSKKQLEMVEAFRRLVADGAVSGWRLCLIGGAVDTDPYAETVRRAAEGLPIEIIANASGEEVARALGAASVYWHAAGLGEDLGDQPVRFEHFGIAVVEAMSAGGIPVVYGLGGPAEIVEDGLSGLHFFDIDELVTQTRMLLADTELAERLRSAAQARATAFSEQRFETLVGEVMRSQLESATWDE